MARVLDETVVIYCDLTTVPFSKEALAYMRKSLPKYCFCDDYNIQLAIYDNIAALPDSDKDVIFNDEVPKYFEPPGVVLEEMVLDMKNWAVYGPPPLNFMVVTGDRDLVPTLQDLRNRGYNILLAHPSDDERDFSDLVAVASCVWKESALKSEEEPYRVPDVLPNRPNKKKKDYKDKNKSKNKNKQEPDFSKVPVHWEFYIR